MLVIGSAAQSSGSFSNLNIEYGELKVTIERLLGENKLLREAVEDKTKALIDMRTTLAASSGEAAIVQRKATQMKLRMDALGVDTISGNGGKVEQRLLAAVDALRAVSAERTALSVALVRLIEAASFHARTATHANPQSRLTLESEIRNANIALAPNSGNASDLVAHAPTMIEGMVISTRDEMALIVLNLGSKQGVNVGTPFQIFRNEKIIGRVRVVDVREKIAGAIIQNLSSEHDRIKVGDRLKVDTQQ